jgi:hypothetical protein
MRFAPFYSVCRAFAPFYFDGNRRFGLVDSPEKWAEFVFAYEGDVGRLLEATQAPMADISSLPPAYHFGTPGVRTGEIPSFGFRREHLAGTITLAAWAAEHEMDLWAMAARGLWAMAAGKKAENT